MKKRLVLSVVSDWRSSEGLKLEDTPNWREVRSEALRRDGFACYFCGFASPKYMEVHHKGGVHKDNSLENLVSLCPFCHSCLHIGFSGVKGRGSLLVLERGATPNQAKMNRILLESLTERGDESLFFLMRKNLPVREDRGAEGLVMLANLILERARSGLDATPPGNLLFMPNPDEYQIAKFLKSLSGNALPGEGHS